MAIAIYKVTLEGVGQKKQKVKTFASELEGWTSVHLSASGIWASSSQHPGVPP